MPALPEPDPALAPPRYSDRALPDYRYVPGVSAHPRQDSAGHSFASPEPECRPWTPQEWRELAPWLYGIDLYNFGFWWESHEQLEALWLAAGRTSTHARFVQGLLQVAAALLGRHLGRAGAARLARDGVARMRGALAPHDAVYMGIDVPAFTGAAAELFADRRSTAPLIRLHR